MTQWPSFDKVRDIVSSWTTSLHPTECVNLCSRGLLPKTTKGFTVFWTLADKPTSLTCTIHDSPPSCVIEPCMLVNVSLCCLYAKMHPESMVAFCKREFSSNQDSMFWRLLCAQISFSTNFSLAISTVSLLGNPWQREFSYGCSLRLLSRGSSNNVDKFIDAALSKCWESNVKAAWPAAISRWIVEHQIPYDVCRSISGASFMIYGVAIQIERRALLFLFLMCLFCDGSLNWGEKRPIDDDELPEPVLDAFNLYPFIHFPESPVVHRLMVQCMNNSD